MPRIEVEDGSRRQELEMIVIEIESWLLRDNDQARPQDHYSDPTLERFGQNLVQDSYARIVRSTINYILEEENGD